MKKQQIKPRISYLQAIELILLDINQSSLGDSFFNSVRILSEILDKPFQEVFDYLVDFNLKYELLSMSQTNKVLNIVYKKRRLQKLPYQYIFKEIEWFGLKLTVNKSVLIPRPETELLTQLIVLEESGEKQILDIGTGSGNIAIALALNLRNSSVHGVDKSKRALRIAKQNAHANKANVAFYQSDIFSNVNVKYDLIVSNPPYVCKNDVDRDNFHQIMHEPKMALFPPDSEKKGLYYYKKILKDARNHLLPHGKIYLELNHKYVDEIATIAKKNELNIIRIFKDFNDFDRFIVLGD